MRFIDPDGMYSTEEWKKDNGITDDDLITIYQSPSDEVNSQKQEPEKEEKTRNLIESSIKAWRDNFRLSGFLVNNLFGNEDASESENIELGFNLWTFKFMLFTAMLEPGASSSNSTNKLNEVVETSSKTTKGKGRVFWSGGTAAMNEAADYAASRGLTTLEMTRAGKNLTKLTTGMPWEVAGPMWKRLSTVYAKGAKGPVVVVQNATSGVSLESVWRTVEYPILKL